MDPQIEETQPKNSQTGYGKRWDGRFMKVAEVQELLPTFRDFYFEERKKNMKKKLGKIVEDFNEKIAPITFFPHRNTIHRWQKTWDPQIQDEINKQERAETTIVNVRDDDRAVSLVPTEEDLETGTRTLGGMLMNDAVSVLKDSQEREDDFSAIDIAKRRSYVLNVFAYVTRHVQGKENLKLKANAEKRETASFLMHILNMAKSGKIESNEVVVLEHSITDGTSGSHG